VTHDHQDTRRAAAAGGVLPQGRLNNGNGRRAADEARRPPVQCPAYRLKRSVERFEASGGGLYLLRVGTSENFVLPEPRPWDRLVLDALAEGYVESDAVRERLAQAGLPGDELDGCIGRLEDLGLVERRPAEALLTADQAHRYDRQLIYFSDLAPAGLPAEELQRRLGAAKVALIGCGGLGSWTACGLACAGVGSLVLVDDDRVELSNLNRQLLFTEADVGELKVEAAARALAEHNSALELTPLARRVRGIEDVDEVIGEGVDLLIVTADWPPYELPRWVNAACLHAETPYVTAGQLLPVVRVGPWIVPRRTACLECMERQWALDSPIYEELAEARAQSTPPAATIGAASGVVGSILAMEAIHFLSGVLEPSSLDSAIVLDLRTMALTREETVRDPDCPSCAKVR
jgi:bacteriocin biosynthesis cyclodehydratase domain-containing protein